MKQSSFLSILQLAASDSLPKAVDHLSRIDLGAFKALVDAGLVDAAAASADDGECFLNPSITLAGIEYLRMLSPEMAIPWWRNFDRRMAVIGIVVSLVGTIVSVAI